VGEVYAPFTGKIKAVNQAVVDAPELVNQSPYDGAWFVELEFEGVFPLEGLLNAAAYQELTE